jgi:phage gpG-like protein
VSAPISVKGASRLTVTLHAAAREIERQQSNNSDVARGIRARAQPPRRTGRLAASLTSSATDTEAVVGSDLVYAPVIEHGWPAHGIEARHFLADAAEASTASSIQVYVKGIGDVLVSVKGA